MTKFTIALVLLASVANLEAQNIDVASDRNQEETIAIQDRKTRLIEILKETAADVTLLSNEQLIEIIRKKQREISDLYKIDSNEQQHLRMQGRYLALATGGFCAGALGLILYGIRSNLQTTKARMEFFKQYENSPFFDLLDKEDSRAARVTFFTVLFGLTAVGLYLWTFLLNNSTWANSADMQKLKEEYALLEDQIQLIKDGCSARAKTIEA